MSTQLGAIEGLHAPGGVVIERQRYLFGPVVDFICFGGGSFMVIALVVLFHTMHAPPPPQLLFVVLFAATILNFPHFLPTLGDRLVVQWPFGVIPIETGQQIVRRIAG